MKQIITLLASNLTQRCEMQMGIRLTLTPSLKEEIVEKHSDVKMGARPLKRAIQTMVEDALAEEIYHVMSRKYNIGTTGSFPAIIECPACGRKTAMFLWTKRKESIIIMKKEHR